MSGEIWHLEREAIEEINSVFAGLLDNKLNQEKPLDADLLMDSMKFVSSKIRKETVIKLLEKI